VVFGALILRWMVSSFDDWVPLAAPQELPAGVAANDLPRSAQFRCPAPWGDGESGVATPQATQALEGRSLPDPSIVVAQELAREPCVEARAQRRAIGIVNLVACAGLLLVLTTHRRRGAREGPTPRSPAPSAAP
jgi:hypothetical protein